MKYSWDSFDHIILKDGLTKSEAQSLEKSLIQQYQTRNPDYGYNIAEGGTGGVTCINNKHPLSKNVYQYNLDGSFVKEWVNAQRASEDLDICVSDIHANCRENNGVKQAGGFIWSYCYAECVNPYVRLTGSRESILQMDNNFNIIQTYDCISYVDKKLYDREKVTNCCMRRSLTHNGFYWCYEKDYHLFKNYVLEKLNHIKTSRKTTNTKPICQYNEQHELINTYISARDVEEKTGINKNTVQAYCKRGMNNYGFNSTGFYWMYDIDISQENAI